MFVLFSLSAKDRENFRSRPEKEDSCRVVEALLSASTLISQQSFVVPTVLPLKAASFFLL